MHMLPNYAIRPVSWQFRDYYCYYDSLSGSAAEKAKLGLLNSMAFSAAASDSDPFLTAIRRLAQRLLMKKMAISFTKSI